MINFPKDQIKNFSNLLDYFKNLSGGAVNGVTEKWLLMVLDSTLPIFFSLKNKSRFPIIERITINKNVIGKNKRIDNLNFLKYPPPEKVKKYGRCNIPGTSVLYGTFMKPTAMMEMAPKVGDLITISKWKLKDDYKLTYAPIFMNQPTDGMFNPRTFEIIRQFDEQVNKIFSEPSQKIVRELNQFIADSFTKHVGENHQDYLFSSYFSNRLMHVNPQFSVEAIYYPSVQSKLNQENIAIRTDVFDQHYVIEEVKDSIITIEPSFGNKSYLADGLGSCKNFDFTSGKILWDPSKNHQSSTKIFEHKLNHNLDLDV
ncbi:RES domain-containing protein [Cyclobacterium marinum]|uniref:RES domain-containing protein n=1 Tax=Cyclobacterium marinum TaxID=104 RepID=UPI0011EC522E|nr:RES domain-containing protein [Cyclobacterium marinum]MBI0398018.1 RES domain-containing protein [Cyclobacterium marinum]